MVKILFQHLLKPKKPLRSAGFILVLCLGLASCATRPTTLSPSTSSPVSQESIVSPEEAPLGTIGPGDLLEVIVRRGAGEERFTPTVREDGTVSVSFVNVTVKGLTPGQAAARIEIQLTPFIREPRVQVLIKKKTVTVQKVLDLGEVKKPGVYPLDPNLTVLQAIAGADSYTETAVLEDVRIIRGGLAQPVILSSNIERLLKKGDLSQNLLLQNNDIVYVPRQKIGDWNAFLAKISPTLSIFIQLPINTFFQVQILRETLTE